MEEVYDFLREYAEMDVKKKLENKLIEYKVGYWERMSADDDYPVKIPCRYDDPLPQFSSVTYSILDQPVSVLPPLHALLTMNRYPNQILTMIVDGKVGYKYHFSNLKKEHPAFLVIDSTEIYSILYALACQRNLGVLP